MFLARTVPRGVTKQRPCGWASGNQRSDRKSLSKQFRKAGMLAIKHQPAPAIVSITSQDADNLIVHRLQLKFQLQPVPGQHGFHQHGICLKLELSRREERELIQTSSEEHGDADPPPSPTFWLHQPHHSFLWEAPGRMF